MLKLRSTNSSISISSSVWRAEMMSAPVHCALGDVFTWLVLSPRQLAISVASNLHRISGHALRNVRSLAKEQPYYATFGSVSAPRQKYRTFVCSPLFRAVNTSDASVENLFSVRSACAQVATQNVRVKCIICIFISASVLYIYSWRSII